MKHIVISIFAVLFLCSCKGGRTDATQDVAQAEMHYSVSSEQPECVSDGNDADDVESPDVHNRTITAEMAYEGVNNYCHKEYDWSVAEENPSIMYVKMDEETETEYKVVFRSYTGSFVYFYVNKKSGATRMVEHVPSLGIEEEAGTIDLFEFVGL